MPLSPDTARVVGTVARYQPSLREERFLIELRSKGWHVERESTYANRMKEREVLASRLLWAEDEKDHHEKWLAGILEESQRLQRRFNLITGALAVSGVEWSTIAELLGDEDVSR